MANELDELTGPVNGAGRDVNVIEKQIPVTVGFGSTLFEVVLWLLFVVPGLVFLFMKIGARNYFRRLQQKIQSDASTIDNYLEQRVQILQNLAGLVSKAINLDKEVMTAVAAYRGGIAPGSDRNAVQAQPRSPTPSSRTPTSRRRSRPRASSTTTPSASGTRMSSPGRRSRSSPRAPATPRASRSRPRPR